MRLYLASASPRRRDLLAAAGVACTCLASHAAERWPPGPADVGAIDVAEQKLRASWAKFATAAADPFVSWLAADTAVILDGEVLGKPTDAAHARATLGKLAGRRHEVVTGFVVGRLGEVLHREAVTTEVRMRGFGAAEIGRYVDTGEPMDKAGAYAVQGLGHALVAEVRGSLTNVVGLPLPQVLAALAKYGGDPAAARASEGPGPGDRGPPFG